MNVWLKSIRIRNVEISLKVTVFKINISNVKACIRKVGLCCYHALAAKRAASGLLIFITASDAYHQAFGLFGFKDSETCLVVDLLYLVVHSFQFSKTVKHFDRDRKRPLSSCLKYFSTDQAGCDFVSEHQLDLPVKVFRILGEVSRHIQSSNP